MAQISRRSLANYAVVRIIAGESISKVAKETTAALSENGKKKEADLLVADIFEMLESRGILANATVTSAKPLTVENRKKLELAIAKNAKVNNVIINEVIDERVIGGFRVETARHAWDKTVAHKLAMIKGGI